MAGDKKEKAKGTSSVPNVPKKEIAKDVWMPVLGFGTYYQPEVGKAIKWAIDCGYRLIDTAEMYRNEELVGKAIKDKISEGVVKRADLFLTSKVWCFSHREHEVVESCKGILKRLGMEYLDLFLIHAPFGFNFRSRDIIFPYREDGTLDTNDVDYLETWRGMEKCLELGLVKSIGLSNFNKQQVERVLANCKVPPANLQVEINPQNSQRELVDFCNGKNISVTAATPIGRPEPHSRTPRYYFDGRFLRIAKKYGKTAAQVAIRYGIDIGACPIPRSVNKERIAENFNVFDFKLTPEEIKLVDDSFNDRVRFIMFTNAKGHKYHFMSEEEFPNYKRKPFLPEPPKADP